MIPATCPEPDTLAAARKRIWAILDEVKAGKRKWKTTGDTALNLELRRIGRRFPAILIEETNADLANAVPASRIITCLKNDYPEVIEGIVLKVQILRTELTGVGPPLVLQMAAQVAVAIVEAG